MIQEWIYLGLAAYGLLSIIMTLAYLSLWLEEKLINNKFNFEKRLLRGEILSKDNIFWWQMLIQKLEKINLVGHISSCIGIEI